MHGIVELTVRNSTIDKILCKRKIAVIGTVSNNSVAACVTTLVLTNTPLLCHLKTVCAIKTKTVIIVVFSIPK